MIVLARDVVSQGGDLSDRVSQKDAALKLLAGIPDRHLVAFILHEVGLLGERWHQARIAKLLKVSQQRVGKMIEDVRRTIAQNAAAELEDEVYRG